jgi:hypothetical protein
MGWWIATALVLLQGGAPSGSPPDAPKQDAPKQDAPKQDVPKTDTPPPPPQEGTPPATPPTGQEKPTRSQALEDLLKRLQQERGTPTLVPPNPNAPPTPEGTPVAPAQPALLRRASDPVQVAFADGHKRDLQFWDARLDLDDGDEVRQGAGSCTLLEFAEGARYRIDGVAIWRLDSETNATPRLVLFTQLVRSAELDLGHGEFDTVFTLPGGNELASRNTRLFVRGYEDRALEIRNSGPDPAVVRSPYLGARVITLHPGQVVYMPVLPEPSAYIPHLTHDTSVFDEQRGRLYVQAPDQITLSAGADAVDVAARGPAAGIARACGARMVLTAGQSMRVTRAPIGYTRLPEWEE